MKITPKVQSHFRIKNSNDMHRGLKERDIATASWKAYSNFNWAGWMTEYPDDAEACYGHPLALWSELDNVPLLDYLTLLAKKLLNTAMANVASEGSFKDYKQIVPPQRNRLAPDEITATHFILQDLRQQQKNYVERKRRKKSDWSGICERFANFQRLSGGFSTIKLSARDCCSWVSKHRRRRR